MVRPPPTSSLFPYTTLFRSAHSRRVDADRRTAVAVVVAMAAPLVSVALALDHAAFAAPTPAAAGLVRSEEHTSELQSRGHLVCRLLLEKKKDDCKYTLWIID